MSYHPARFGGHSHFVSAVKMNSVCHVILQNHAIKVSCDFVGGSPLWQVTTLLCFVTIGTVVVEILYF